MSENMKTEYLIVDTSAFIKNAPLQDIGVNIITEQDVVSEITNKRQLRRLVVLPYDLKVKQASPEYIKFVTEFAKKTGDYCSLSATDIKVIALTYQYEKENVGTDHLRTTPIVSKTVDSSTVLREDFLKPMAGFFVPQKNLNTDNMSDTEQNVKDQQENEKNEESEHSSYYSEDGSNSESDYETPDTDDNTKQELCERFSKLDCEPTEFVVKDTAENEHNVDDILAPISTANTDDKEKCLNNTPYEDDSDENHDNDESTDNEDADDSSWITPKNIAIVKKEIDLDMVEEKPVTVACLTMDFAMQNVLKQIGLNVATLEGKVIKQMRTFILRCYACFKTTSIMTKVFCPSCGHKTLKKVAVSLDDEGKPQVHINYRRPISKKGKRFSLPMPRGGKHANNPILVEDQPVPDQRLTRLARTKNNPLEDDYIAGYSPFIMRDVNSKSAMLGIRPNSTVKYWMKKNPNENRRKRK